MYLRVYSHTMQCLLCFRYGWWTCSKRRLVHLPASCRRGHVSPSLPLPCMQQLPKLCVPDREAKAATHRLLQQHPRLGRSRRALVYDLSHRNLRCFVIRDTLIVWGRLCVEGLASTFSRALIIHGCSGFCRIDDRLRNWMNDCWVGWAADELILWLIDRVNDCWLTDWPISWMTDGLVYN